jgi:hypothetical protein
MDIKNVEISLADCMLVIQGKCKASGVNEMSGKFISESLPALAPAGCIKESIESRC